MDKVNNFYAMYLLKIFDFEAERAEEEYGSEKDWLKPHVTYEPFTDGKKVKFSED